MFHDFKLLGTDAALDIDIHLDKGKQFYCFFGENGVGKTNLLRYLARTLLAVHSMFLKEKGSYRYGALFLQSVLDDDLKDLKLDLPKDVEINGTRIKDNEIETWRYTTLKMIQQLQLLRRPIKEADGLAKPCVIDKPIVMVAASGRGHTKNLAESELRFVKNNFSEFIAAFRRTWCAMNQDAVLREDIAGWIATRLLVNPAFLIESRQPVREVIELCDILASFDPIFKELIERPSKGQTNLRIVFHEGNLHIQNVPIDKLATGYVSIVKILQEIISAYGAWGALVGESNLRDLDGIVLIDELESHLHPRWQAALVPLLKRSFPKTTFIVCTHSPLIVAQTEEGEAYELVRTEQSVTSRRLGRPADWYLVPRPSDFDRLSGLSGGWAGLQAARGV